MQQQIISVSEFLDVVNMLLSTEDVYVQGEVTGAHPHPTGMYFSLKDEEGGGIMDCYMSPTLYRNIGIELEDGMLVRAGGIASVYKPKGRFSFRVAELELAGEGSLKKAYEALKKKLFEEGLFDRKRPLPEFVSRVGLITSKTSAAIGDFRKNLAPLGIRILHRDVRVEGDKATPQVRAALEWFNGHAADIDVIVIVRGGGSLEDLQAFNDEHVVRAVFGSRVPTLVSIGHERDVPLSQMAADASASTPTGAAQAVNETWERLRDSSQTAQRLSFAYESVLTSTRADVSGHAHRLGTYLVRLSGAADQLAQRLRHGLSRVGHRIEHIKEATMRYERQLAGSSPERLLKLGYSIVSDETGGIVRAAKELRPGQSVRTRLAKGSFVSDVKELLSD